MSQKFTVRVHDPKGFARAFKLAAATAWKASRRRYGNNRICDCVLLRAEGCKATLQATDLEQYLTLDLGLLVGLTLDGEGCLLLPQDWKPPAEPFTLESEPSDTASTSSGQAGPIVTLKHGAITKNIPQSHDVPEWPLFPLGNTGVKFELPAAALAHHFSMLANYCAGEKGRYALSGLFWEFGGVVNQPLKPQQDSFPVTLVATDGKHLAAHGLGVTTTKAPRYQAILHHGHAANVASIIKALDAAEEPNVEVGFAPEVETTNDLGEVTEVHPHDGYMFFGNRKWSLAARMVEGQFPDWHSVVPKNDATVLLRRQQYADALNAVKGATSAEAVAVRHTFNADHLLLEAKSSNGYAKAQVSLPAVPPQMILGLDPEYLLQALDALTGEWVVFEFRSAEYGVNLHDGDPSLRYHLVMPIDLIGDRPNEPEKPTQKEAEETWNAKAGVWEKTTPEQHAAAKAEFDEAMAQYEKDYANFKLELAQWRISQRIYSEWPENTNPDEEKQCEHSQFPARPQGEPEIGATLAPAPTLDELREQALTANTVAKPKARKARSTASTNSGQAGLRTGQPAPAPVAVRAPSAQPTSASSEEEAYVETAAQLGYGLDQNQSTFGW